MNFLLSTRSLPAMFPLPLTAPEEYMLHEDRTAYPAAMFLQLRFSGLLERDILESAFHDAMRHHPLLTAIVRKDGRGGWEWTAADGDYEYFRWTDGHGDLTPLMPFDIRTRPGVFLTGRQTSDRTELLFQIHHSCCDGRGGFSFIGSVFMAYASRLETRSGDGGQVKRAGGASIDIRKGMAIPWREAPRIVREQWTALAGIRQFFSRSPVPLIPHRPAPPDEPMYPGYPARCSRSFDPLESSRLRFSAMGQGAMSNDLLIRDLFRAVAEWQQRQGRTNPRDWLRITVPVDMRRFGEIRHVTGNRTSLVFLDRRRGDTDDPGLLLSGIHDEMELIKELRLGYTFLGSLRILSMFPGLRDRLRSRESCQSTCVLSNLGKLLNRLELPRCDGRIVLGHAVLEGMECIGPLRPLTCAVVCVFDYADRTTVTVHYDARVLAKPQAEDLLATYMRCLKQSMQPPS
jgi:hypothetical protein